MLNENEENSLQKRWKLKGDENEENFLRALKTFQIDFHLIYGLET